MHEASRKNLRNFGLALGAAFLILGTRLYFKHHNASFLSLTIIGICLAISGLTIPVILRPIYTVFNKIAYFIFNWLITKTALILLFYFGFTPTGLLIKIMGKDLLGLKINKATDSYWIKRNSKIMDLKQYEKQF